MSRAMKDSGVSWIGEIPEEWDVLRLKSLFSFGKGLPITKENLQETGIPVISYGQIHSKTNTGVKLQDELFRFVNPSYVESNPESLVHPGDIIVADTSEDTDGCGNCSYVDQEIQLFAGYHTIILRALERDDSKYIAYLMKTDPWRSQIRSRVSGVKVFSISRKILSDTFVLYPPFSEQSRIAAFLDRRCAEIDRVIAATQRTIEEYKKLKQSIITEAVTHGVRGSRKKKGSGLEWIREIPEEWDVLRLKSLFSFGKGLPITKDNLEENGIPVISYGQIHSKTNSGVKLQDELFRFVNPSYVESNPESLVHPGDIIVADTSEDIDGCGNCSYIDQEIRLFAGYHTIVLRAVERDDSKYIAYQMKTDSWRSQIRSRVSGVKVFSISRKILSDTFVLYPPRAEQSRIVDYLDNRCAEIDRLIDAKQQLLIQLESYKKSVIYEYVTGKREV